MRPAPLPPRDGLGPARLRVRGGALGDELLTRFGPDVAAKAIAGEVVDQRRCGARSRHRAAGRRQRLPLPRPARRGAGAVRHPRAASGRRHRGRRQAALPGHHAARAPRRADRAGAVAPGTRITRAEPGPPAGPADRRGAAVHHPPRSSWRLPDAVRPRLRSTRPIVARAAVDPDVGCRAWCAAGLSSAAAIYKPSKNPASPTPRRWSSCFRRTDCTG